MFLGQTCFWVNFMFLDKNKTSYILKFHLLGLMVQQKKENDSCKNFRKHEFWPDVNITISIASITIWPFYSGFVTFPPPKKYYNFTWKRPKRRLDLLIYLIYEVFIMNCSIGQKFSFITVLVWRICRLVETVHLQKV